MPTIFEPKDLSVRNEGDTTYTTLADAAMLGTDALQVEQIVLGAGKVSEAFGAAEAERFLYVIRGAGQVQIENETYPLAPESMLWVEPGETFTLEANDEPLEVLVCQAPAKRKPSVE